eukprot:GDKI01034271.1.p1 GENE.GDKI01034271.1~~GDKI01034271.1.p1  ORF type:complete len:124 (-),score=18.16 GDKI01034271.1:192-563(-)
MFLSTALFGKHSKRLLVQLYSSAQTGYKYLTEKSGTKKNFRAALRKHDPVVDQHVVLYEGRRPTPRKQALRTMLMKNMRFTGKNMQPLMKRVEKWWEAGRFSKFNERYPSLVDSRGRSLPRMS